MSSEALDAVEALARAALADRDHRPLVLGLCGAQGSGKSTLANHLARRMGDAGVATAILSIDDLYHTRAKRLELARTIHPLFATRGPPGTHDIALGLATLAALDRGQAARLPRFDKAIDDRAPEPSWPCAPADTRLVILEGWCVGALPQPENALTVPVNALEAREDTDNRWRRAANAALGGDYQALFGRIDRLILLAAPGFEVVRGWRIEQEHDLARAAGPDASGVMSDAAIDRFIQHYERLTRHILAEMPPRADLVVRLNPERSVAGAR